MKKRFTLILIGLILFSSCGTNHLLENNLANANESGQMKKTGQQLAEGVDAKTISQQLVLRLSDALNDSVFRKNLQDLISSLLTQSGSSTAKQIDSIKLILIAALDEITAQVSKSENVLLGDSFVARITGCAGAI